MTVCVLHLTILKLLNQSIALQWLTQLKMFIHTKRQERTTNNIYDLQWLIFIIQNSDFFLTTYDIINKIKVVAFIIIFKQNL